MDPGTAIGVASGCIAFYEFSIKLAKAVKKIHEAGGQLPDDFKRMYALIKSLERLLIRVHHQVELTQSYGPVTEADNDLVDIIDQCCHRGQEFLDVFEKIDQNLIAKGNISWMGDVQKAFRVLRKTGQVQEIQRKLEKCKFALLLHMNERMMVTIENMK
jgi:N-terminal domain on NACHT_NTPase and P-loop NTPases